MKLMYIIDVFLDEKVVLFRVKIMYLNYVYVIYQILILSCNRF